jgi:hypothetical protein
MILGLEVFLVQYNHKTWWVSPFNFDGSDTVIASKMIRDVYNNTDTIFVNQSQLLNILL